VATIPEVTLTAASHSSGRPRAGGTTRALLGRLGVQPGVGGAQPCQPPSRAGQLGGDLGAAGEAVLAVLALVSLGSLAQDLGDFLLKLARVRWPCRRR
jgi:hypothetical protein